MKAKLFGFNIKRIKHIIIRSKYVTLVIRLFGIEYTTDRFYSGDHQTWE